jgi:glutamate 5-kinase
MRTKIEAARIARACGCATLIAAGGGANPLARLREGARVTLVAPSGSPGKAYKQWIAGTLVPAGALVVDDGAARALRSGRSLLPAGIGTVEGQFERGVCVRILDSGGVEIARGLTRYTSLEAERIRGASSGRIEALLGYTGPDEIIHRDDLVLM